MTRKQYLLIRDPNPERIQIIYTRDFLEYLPISSIGLTAYAPQSGEIGDQASFDMER
jgi:hypothetical protein